MAGLTEIEQACTGLLTVYLFCFPFAKAFQGYTRSSSRMCLRIHFTDMAVIQIRIDLCGGNV